MHITAGKHRKRRIEAPAGRDVRPTSSMVREAIFNMLVHGEPAQGQNALLIDQPVADICCGCGTLGLEALSRGAKHVTFVDKGRVSMEQTKFNVAQLDETANASFIKADATMLPPARSPVSVVFLDPPYGQELADKIITSLLAGDWLMQGGVLVLELDIKDNVPTPEGLELIKEKAYGKSKLALFRRS